LYMSGMALITMFVLLGSEKKLKHPGQLFGLYLTIYGPVRFYIESIRWYEDSMKPFQSVGSAITVSQMLSVAITIGGIYLLSRKQPIPVRRKQQKVEVTP